MYCSSRRWRCASKRPEATTSLRVASSNSATSRTKRSFAVLRSNTTTPSSDPVSSPSCATRNSSGAPNSSCMLLILARAFPASTTRPSCNASSRPSLCFAARTPAAPVTPSGTEYCASSTPIHWHSLEIFSVSSRNSSARRSRNGSRRSRSFCSSLICSSTGSVSETRNSSPTSLAMARASSRTCASSRCALFNPARSASMIGRVASPTRPANSLMRSEATSRDRPSVFHTWATSLSRASTGALTDVSASA
mmetsp:Transcript_92594/g.293629  ORF Transcript_92594/g.293629 Transcript_92594/m.293629 type:complete len:251 (+) Transcript_92594:1101-1853(+)